MKFWKVLTKLQYSLIPVTSNQTLKLGNLGQKGCDSIKHLTFFYNHRSERVVAERERQVQTNIHDLNNSFFQVHNQNKS